MLLTLLYIVAGVLVVAIILYVVTILGGGKGRVHSGINKTLIKNKWGDIEQSLISGNVTHMNSAVMEADKLFDYALKGITGDKQGTMGDRLKIVQKRFSDYGIYQGVWEAHKVRNRLAHEINAEIMSLESKRAIEKFKKGLKDLKIL